MNQTKIKNFKRDYHRRERNTLHVQVPHLGRQANYFKDKYEKTKHWTAIIRSDVRFEPRNTKSDPDEPRNRLQQTTDRIPAAETKPHTY